MNPRLRRLGVLLLLPMVLLLSSCVKLELTTVIKSEDEITISMTTTYDKAKLAQLGVGVPSKDEVCSTDEESSFKKAKTEPFETDTTIGCKVTGTMTLAEFNEGETPKLTLADGVWTFTMKGTNTGTSQTNQISKDMFDGFMIKVTFPGKVLSHSGSSTVDGNSVTWTDVNDLLTGGGLTATGKDGGGFPTWAWFAIGAVALAAIGGGVFGVLSASKKKQQQAAAAAAAGYGAGPMGPYGQQGYGAPDPYGQGQYPQQQYPAQQQAQPYPGQDPYGQAPQQFNQQQFDQQQFGQQQPAQQFPADPYGQSQPSANQWGGQSQPSANQWGGPAQPPADQWGQPQQPPAEQWGQQPPAGDWGQGGQGGQNQQWGQQPPQGGPQG